MPNGLRLCFSMPDTIRVCMKLFLLFFREGKDAQLDLELPGAPPKQKS